MGKICKIENMEKGFLEVIEDHVKDIQETTKRKSIIFRFNSPYGFMELKPEFVLECIKAARKLHLRHIIGDEINPLERLALYVMEEAHWQLR